MNRAMGRVRRLLGRWWLRQVGMVAVLLGRKRAALDAYRRILELDPGNVNALATVGNMLAESHDADGAMACFRHILEDHEDHADTWFNLGYLHEKRDELAEAERCFRQAVALKPSLDRAWYGLGLVLIRENRLGDAAHALKRNTQLQPFNPYGWYQLGMTYHHLGRPAEARRIYLELRKFEPGYAATLKRDLETTRPLAASEPRQEDPCN